MILYLGFSPQHWSLDLLGARLPNNAVSVGYLRTSSLHFGSRCVFDWFPVVTDSVWCTNSSGSKRLGPLLRLLGAVHVITHPTTALFQADAAVVTFVSGIRIFSGLRGLLKSVNFATATILITTCPFSIQVGNVISFLRGWTFRLLFRKFMGIWTLWTFLFLWSSSFYDFWVSLMQLGLMHVMSLAH